MAKNNNLTDFVTDIADAIRIKTGKYSPINPQDFSDEIRNIEAGGDVTLKELTVKSTSEEQKIEAKDEDCDGFSSVTVEAVKLYHQTLKSNGTFIPNSGYDGMNKVTVSVNLNMEAKIITENGVYYPKDGNNGFSYINVKVPTEANLTPLEVTENGSYDPDPDYDGYSGVTVNVQAKLQSANAYASDEREIVVKPDSSHDGLSSVTIGKINAGTCNVTVDDIVSAFTNVREIIPTTMGRYFNRVKIDKITPAELDSDIIPENIKKDVEILGVTGTYEGETKDANLADTFEATENREYTVEDFGTDESGREYVGVKEIVVNIPSNLDHITYIENKITLDNINVEKNTQAASNNGEIDIYNVSDFDDYSGGFYPVGDLNSNSFSGEYIGFGSGNCYSPQYTRTDYNAGALG